MGEYIISIEIGRKQKYIFSSNHLAENVGASIIKSNYRDDDEQYEFYLIKKVPCFYKRECGACICCNMQYLAAKDGRRR